MTSEQGIDVLSPLPVEDSTPARPRARREITGGLPNGWTYKATAFAEPLPDAVGHGRFKGEGNIEVSARGYYVLRIDFTQIDDMVELLHAIQEAAIRKAAS